MLQQICFAPVFLCILYCIYLVIRPASRADQFFQLSRRTKKESILKRLKILGELNSFDYQMYDREIERFYADGRITEREATRIERIITNTYFDHFSGRWAAFRRADASLKFMFFLMLAYGFVYVNLAVMYGYDKLHDPGMSKTSAFVLANATLFLPFVFGILLAGILIITLELFNSLFSRYGGINRAAITCEEMIQSLKPGGRDTRVIVVKDFHDYDHPWEF